jgi:cyclic pyranopterin phosphate synthase
MAARKRPASRTSRAPRATLSHVTGDGSAAMVDVTRKPATARRALAEGRIVMSRAAFLAIRDAQVAKGDVLGAARIAGVLAAKRTAELIPLCHPLALSDVQVRFTLEAKARAIRCEAEVRTTASTGVEMEAMTAVAVALLTVYDMAKSADKGMRIEGIRLLEKEGGKSGRWTVTKGR